MAITIEPEVKCESLETCKRYIMPPAVNDCQINVGGFCVIVELSSGAMGTGVSSVTGPVVLSVQPVIRKRNRNKPTYRFLCFKTPPYCPHDT